MTDKTGQEFRSAFEAGRFAADASAQMTTVRGREVRRSSVPDVQPGLLVGSEQGHSVVPRRTGRMRERARRQIRQEHSVLSAETPMPIRETLAAMRRGVAPRATKAAAEQSPQEPCRRRRSGSCAFGIVPFAKARRPARTGASPGRRSASGRSGPAPPRRMRRSHLFGRPASQSLRRELAPARATWATVVEVNDTAPRPSVWRSR